MEPMQVLTMLDTKGMCMIADCFENKNFVYFLIIKQEMHEAELNHLLIDKKTGCKRILSIKDDEIINAFGRANMLTDNDELIFLVHQALLVDLIKKYPLLKGNLMDPLNEELNPFVVKVKLKSFK